MNRERGQALVVVLGLAAALGAALLLVFNVGQAINAKQRLVNAADAAAYSAAVWQARSLNYQAYLNRAVVANEVAIAQSVSLRSWSGYMNEALGRIAGYAWVIPKVGQAAVALSRVWWRIDAALQPSLATAELALTELNQVFAAAEVALHSAAVAGTAPVVSDIAARHQHNVSVTPGGYALLARASNDLRDLTQTYARSARSRQADVIVRSRDPFTADRSWTIAPPGLLPPLRLTKRGGTDLMRFDEWRGMDTLAAHVYVPGLFGRWSEGSIGWGAANNGLAVRGRGWHGGSWRANPRSSRRAERATRRAWNYRGVPALRDVAVTRGRRVQSDPQVQLAVELGRPASGIAFAQRALGGARIAVPSGAALILDDAAAGGAMRAIAAARVTFDRPEGRFDGRRERGSLFNPYWRAHLAPVERSSRAVAAAANAVVDPFAGSRQ